MKKQTFNIRSGGFLLGTVSLLSRTDPDETAKRLKKTCQKIEIKDGKRFSRVTHVNHIINM